jgi:glycosyltransferase involved in cell wall biosynthesis
MNVNLEKTSGPVLQHDELAFLVGWVFVDSAEAVSKRRPPLVALRNFARLVSALRKKSPMRRSDLAALCGLSEQTLEFGVMRKFDSLRKADSKRHAIGEALLGARTSVGGFLGANLALLKFGLFTKAKPGAGARANGDQRKRDKKMRPAIEELESWDDVFKSRAAAVHEAAAPDLAPPTIFAKTAAEKPVKKPAKINPVQLIEEWDQIEDELFPEVETEPGLDIEVYQAPEFLIDDELADPVPAAAAPAAKPAAKSLSPSALAAPMLLHAWLCGLGSENSGVRIEPFAEHLLNLTNKAQLQRILSHVKSGNDLLALGVLEGALRGADLKPNEALYLRRLVSVFRGVDKGYQVPARRTLCEYEPVKGSLFYLIHMRDPYEVNGYVTRTHLILASMRAAGLDPKAITRLGFPQDLARHRQAVIAAEEPMNGVPMISLPDPMDGQIGRPILNYIDAYADSIVKLARQHRPAALHAASNYMNGLAAIKAGRILGIPVIYEVRGIWEITQSSASEIYASTLRYKLQRTLENEAVSAADKVITISEPLRRFVIEHGAKDDNVSVVPNAVDSDKLRPLRRDRKVLERLGIGQKEVVIGYVGSVVHYEGLDYIIEALAQLKERGVKGFRFLLVGHGRESASLEALAAKLKVSDLCIFMGRVPRSEVEALYSIIDIAPLPRRSLPVTELVPPLKPFEAMAAGKTVIVSSVEALAGTVIHGETGLIVEKDNVKELVAALRTLIESPGLRKKIGKRSREWVVAERSVPALADQLTAVYQSIAAMPG